VIGYVVRVVALVAVDLLVLTSLDPGDILVGTLLATGIVVVTRPRGGRPAAGWGRWATAVAGTLIATAWEMVVGTIRTVRFCVRPQTTPGFVEIPRRDRSRREVALWGVLTGEAPDEYPVDVDEQRGVLVVHVLDARDPAAVVARHDRARVRWHRFVVR
jgi:multisubunit Na+/H+ antiporter MnhE subunit